jgi:UDP-N-acetylmuramyl pentapeptide phosphotransferase/UDP-N-acetylglucosamine-1-phosphate transferase
MRIVEAVLELAYITDIRTLAYGFVACFLTGFVLVLTKRWHGAFSMDFIEGIQKFHTTPTPRIGGIPILIGLLVVWIKSSLEIKEIIGPILLAGMPAFLFGMAEDLTKRVGVMQRLTATMFSGLLVCYLTDYSLTRLDILGLDALIKITFISVIFTAFALAGVANSINIIDGFNGLATTTCIIAFTGIALIAQQVGDFNLAITSLLFATCISGFFWINWPFGKMFLGDGGAYFIGFSLAWLAILLIERNKSVSAFAALMICILPITEVLLSIFRRKIRKTNPGEPDRLHFHSILQRRYISRWFAFLPNLICNSLVGIIIGMMSLVSSLLANIFFDSTLLCMLISALMAFFYILIYLRMIRHRW